MARIRSINPSAPSDEDVATMSLAARYVWAYLPCFADRLGRLKDSAFSLKHDILPADAIDMDATLEELATRQHIVRYEVAGKKYIQIRNFAKYQAPHVREVDSTIPAAPRVPSTAKAVLGPVQSTLPAMASTPIPDLDPGPDPDPSPGQVDQGKPVPVDVKQPDPECSPIDEKSWLDLLRLFELRFVERFKTPFTRDRFDDNEARSLLQIAGPGGWVLFEPAIAAYLASDDVAFVKADHPFRLFARNFGRFRNGGGGPARRKPRELELA